MLNILIFMLVLSVLIFVHELGHFLIARKIGVRVEKFSLGFGPVLWKMKKGHTEYCIGSIPLGGYVKMSGDSLEECKGKPYEYYSQSPGKRFHIILFGSLFNYILGFLVLCFIFFTGYPTLTTKIGSLLDGFGAQKAGLAVGDKIIAINGQKVVFWEDLQKIIRKEESAEFATITYLRGNEEKSVPVQIREKSVDDPFGDKKSVALIGVTPFDEVVITRHGLFKSFLLGAQRTIDISAVTYKGLWRMVTGRLSVKDSVTGPLGIFNITSQAAGMGLAALLNLVALLSINLGIFNLLPLPILDGGHIILLGVEKLRRKALSAKVENVITQVGVYSMVALALFITYNDIVRFYGEKISKFFK